WWLTDAISLRAGYTWNENPIPNDQSFVNTVAPTILEHTVCVGASWRLTEDFTLSVAYVHGFNNSIEGPAVTPLGPVPGTAVQTSTTADTVVLGGSVRFGGPRRCAAQPCHPEAAGQQPGTGAFE